jgi:hypothetical protein
LTLLFIVNYSAELLKPRECGATIIVLVVTNTLLAAAYVFVSFMEIGGDVGSCIVRSCWWIERAMSFIGGRDTIDITVVQVAINLVPVMLVLALRLWSAARQGDEPRKLERPLVPLRAWQWLLIFALDVVIRHALILPLPVWGLVVTLPMSIGHLGALAVINHAIPSPRSLDNRGAVFLLLFVTNMMFANVFGVIDLDKNGTFCIGDTCYWIKGVMTLAGIRLFLGGIGIQVVINVVCVLVVCALGGNLRKQGHQSCSLQRVSIERQTTAV